MKSYTVKLRRGVGVVHGVAEVGAPLEHPLWVRTLCGLTVGQSAGIIERVPRPTAVVDCKSCRRTIRRWGH